MSSLKFPGDVKGLLLLLSSSPCISHEIIVEFLRFGFRAQDPRLRG